MCAGAQTLSATAGGGGSAAAQSTSPQAALLGTVDPTALFSKEAKGRLPSAGGPPGSPTGKVKVEVETVSGTIAQGRVPSTRGKSVK